MATTTNKAREIESGFLRQINNLERYMCAYSMTLRKDLLTEEEFEKFYEMLCKVCDITNAKFKQP